MVARYRGSARRPSASVSRQMVPRLAQRARASARREQDRLEGAAVVGCRGGDLSAVVDRRRRLQQPGGVADGVVQVDERAIGPLVQMKSVVAVAGLAGADGARQAGVNTTDAPSVSPCGTAPHTLVIPTNAQFAGARGDRSEPFVGRGRQRNMDPVKKIMSFRLR